MSFDPLTSPPYPGEKNGDTDVRLLPTGGPDRCEVYMCSNHRYAPWNLCVDHLRTRKPPTDRRLAMQDLIDAIMALLKSKTKDPRRMSEFTYAPFDFVLSFLGEAADTAMREAPGSATLGELKALKEEVAVLKEENAKLRREASLAHSDAENLRIRLERYESDKGPTPEDPKGSTWWESACPPAHANEEKEPESVEEDDDRKKVDFKDLFDDLVCGMRVIFERLEKYSERLAFSPDELSPGTLKTIDRIDTTISRGVEILNAAENEEDTNE